MLVTVALSLTYSRLFPCLDAKRGAKQKRFKHGWERGKEKRCLAGGKQDRWRKQKRTAAACRSSDSPVTLECFITGGPCVFFVPPSRVFSSPFSFLPLLSFFLFFPFFRTEATLDSWRWMAAIVTATTKV